MKRFLAGFFMLSLPLLASAQPESPAIKVTLYPAAVPVPALKYRLLPEQRDLMPGNAAQLYYRSFSPEWWGAYQRNPKFQEKLEAALHTSLKNLKERKDNDLHWVMGGALKEVDRAARRQYCDWEFLPRLREDGIGMLLPDIQGFRTYSRLLGVRARLQMAEGRYQDADYTLQTMFALSRHVGDGPILIQSLVGIAIGQIGLDQVEAWIQQRDGPNLYWSLTDLPRPFLDLHKAIEAEKLTVDNLCPDLRDMLRRPKLTPMAADDVHLKVSFWRGLGKENGPLNSPFPGLLVATRLYGEAKAFLLAQGRTSAEIEALPVMQTILLHQVTVYDRLMDDLIKWQNLPYPIARRGMEQTEKVLLAEVRRLGSTDYSLAGLVLPAIAKVHFSAVRFQRHVDALRIIEALRLYAAAHNGQLPDKLADVTEVPIPGDPVTGKPFGYKRDGDHATLGGPTLEGLAYGALRYEITMRR